MSDEEEVKSPISVITIVIDENSGNPPKVDLGDMSPLYAHTLLMTVVDTLYDCIPRPKIVWDGCVINEYDLAAWDDEDDDD